LKIKNLTAVILSEALFSGAEGPAFVFPEGSGRFNPSKNPPTESKNILSTAPATYKLCPSTAYFLHGDF
jgi:hypothetical protein